MSVSLRRLEIEDVDDLWRWAQDRELNELTGAWPVAPDRDTMLRLVHGWIIDPHIRAYTIRLGERRIGNCWLGNILGSGATLGISIGERDCWDKGYGTEATRLLVAEGRDLERVTLWAYADNERALAVYRKVGFVVEGAGDRDGRPIVTMGWTNPA